MDEFAGTEDDLGGIAVTFRWVDRGMVGMVGRRVWVRYCVLHGK